MKTKNPFFKKSRLAGLVLAIVAALAISMVAQAAAGGLDPSFGTGGKVITYFGSSNSSANAVAIQSDGKIVVAGSPVLLRYNSNGSLDTTFNNNVIAAHSGLTRGMDVAIQPDGKIVVAAGQNFGVARFNSDGSLDTNFGTSGIATIPLGECCSGSSHSIAIQKDGKILAAGTLYIGNYTDFELVRYDSDGKNYDVQTTDFSPSGGTFDYVTAIAIQTNGKILLAGNTFNGNPPGYRLAFARYNSTDLSLDTSFGANSVIKGTVISNFGNVGMYDYSAALQSDGKIAAVGEYGCSAGTHGCTANGYKYSLARFKSNGKLDTAFGTNGVTITNFSNMSDAPFDSYDQSNDIAIQPDGKLVTGGDTFDGSNYHFFAARFNSSGSVDTNFGTNGEIATAFGNYDDHVHAVVLQPDAKIIAAGSSSNGTNTGLALARYISGTITPVSTTFISQAANDGWILESGKNSGVGGTQDRVSTTLNVGDDLHNKQYRSILSFDTTSIPVTAVVTSAQLKIRKQDVVGTDPFTTHGNLLVDICNGHFGPTIGLELADFYWPTSYGTTMQNITAFTYNWYGVNLSPTNLGFISKGGGVTQFRLRFSLENNNDNNADYIKFYSGNAAVGYQPQLIITYYTP